MKCKVCSAKVPPAVLERICPECGWRGPPTKVLLQNAIAISSICPLCLYFFIDSSNSLYLFAATLAAAGSAFAWANYLIVKKRREGFSQVSGSLPKTQ
jgi:hypothetical protein